MEDNMTLADALDIIGACILATCAKQPGHELISHMLFNAIVEEWLDGNVAANPESLLTHSNTYGTNLYKQAARVIANKVSMLGNVE